MAKKYVPDGACLVCNKGLGFGKLKVTNHKNVSIYGDRSATEGDKVPGANIPCLGICSITHSACHPAPTKWSGTQERVTIGPYRKLLEDSKLGCSVGGQISIFFSVPMALLAIRHNVNDEIGTKAKSLGARVDDWFKKQFDDQEKVNNIMPDAKSRNFALGVVEGVYGGVKGIGEGILFLKKIQDKAVDAGINAITHPVETVGKAKAAASAVADATVKGAQWVTNTDNLKNVATTVGEAHVNAYNWVTTSGNVEKAASSALSNAGQKLNEAEQWASQQSARDWGNYTGRGAFEAGLMATGVGGAKAAVSGAEAANVVAKAGEGANLVAKTGEGVNLAGKAGEAASVTEKVAEAANLTDKAAETRTLGAVVSDTEKAAIKPIPKLTFVVGEEIAGKKIVAVREGTNGKVAVIGRTMKGHVEAVGEELKSQGYSVELFTEKGQDGNSFEIEGGKYLWNDLFEDFKNNNAYTRNEKGWITDESVPNTLMFKANKLWAEKLVDENFTIIDMGTPAPLPESLFYNLETKIIFK